MFKTLHRKEAAIDFPEPNVPTRCQWCGVPLDPTDKVWECMSLCDHYLVCDGCHEEAIIH